MPQPPTSGVFVRFKIDTPRHKPGCLAHVSGPVAAALTEFEIAAPDDAMNNFFAKHADAIAKLREAGEPDLTGALIAMHRAPLTTCP